MTLTPSMNVLPDKNEEYGTKSYWYIDPVAFIFLIFQLESF